MAELLQISRAQGVVDVVVAAEGDVLWIRAKRCAAQEFRVIDLEPWLAEIGVRDERTPNVRLQTFGYCVVDARDVEGRLRVTVTRRSERPEAVIRLHGREAPEFSALGWPKDIQMFADCAQGLILIVGPPASGKTSLTSSLARYVATQDRFTWSLASPIEFEQPSPLVRSYYVGDDGDFTQWAHGVVAAMTSSVDVLDVGQVQDAETAQASLDAARQGKLVLATIVTGNLEQALSQMIKWGCDAEDLARLLVGGAALRLLPRVADPSELVGAAELWVPDVDSRTVIASGTLSAFQDLLRQRGCSLESNLRRLVHDERSVALAEARRAAVYPDEV